MPQLPESFGETEPLFWSVICGCDAGLYREALHEVYIPRIQRGNAYFAADVLGARRALLSVLIHFFEDGWWGAPLAKGVRTQTLTPEDQLFILIQAGLCLTTTRGFASPEARICYERAEPLCRSLNRPRLLNEFDTHRSVALFPRRDLALGRRPTRRRDHGVPCRLPGLSSDVRMVSWRKRLLPNDEGGIDLTSKGAK